MKNTRMDIHSTNTKGLVFVVTSSVVGIFAEDDAAKWAADFLAISPLNEVVDTRNFNKAAK